MMWKNCIPPCTVQKISQRIGWAGMSPPTLSFLKRDSLASQIAVATFKSISSFLSYSIYRKSGLSGVLPVHTSITFQTRWSVRCVSFKLMCEHPFPRGAITNNIVALGEARSLIHIFVCHSNPKDVDHQKRINWVQFFMISRDRSRPPFVGSINYVVVKIRPFQGLVGIASCF